MPLPIAGYGQFQTISPGAAVNNGLLGFNLLRALLDQQQGAYDEAKQANESRYQDILKLFGDNRQRTMGELADFGTSLVNDVNRSYDDKRTELLTSLADRGLSNSTARIGVETGIKRERDAALNRIKDMLIQDRTQADLRFTDRATGVMERRQDLYPEGGGPTANLTSQLISALAGGAAGGALGGTPNYRQQSQERSQLRALIRAGQIANQQPGRLSETEMMQRDAAQQQAEQTQRRENLALFLAEHPNTGGYTTDKERSALSQMIMSGQAAYDPSKEGNVPKVQAAPYYYGGSESYAPTYYSRVPLWQRDPSFANVLAKKLIRKGQGFQIAGDATPTQHVANNTPGTYGPLTFPLAVAQFATNYGKPLVNQAVNSLRSYFGF